jgi:hypothetical protein
VPGAAESPDDFSGGLGSTREGSSRLACDLNRPPIFGGGLSPAPGGGVTSALFGLTRERGAPGIGVTVDDAGVIVALCAGVAVAEAAVAVAEAGVAVAAALGVSVGEAEEAAVTDGEALRRGV